MEHVTQAFELDFAQLLDGYATSPEAYERVLLILLGVLCEEPEEAITSWLQQGPGGSEAIDD